MKEVYAYQISTGELTNSYPVSDEFADKHVLIGNREHDYYYWAVQVYLHSAGDL